MNRVMDELQRNPARAFDRLVDGEWSEAERRALLLALDEEPAGWRGCALAFLEAQSLRSDLSALRSGHLASDGSVEQARAASHKPWRRRFAAALALAASLLGAYGLGLWAKPNRSDFVAPDAAALVRTERPAQPADLPPGWRTVSVGLPGAAGEREHLDVPVRQADQVDWDWVANQPSSLTPAMTRALEQAGMRVTRERQVWPIELENGQQVILPVDQLDLHYVGGTR